ncbi:MAG TPA: serine hydrolase domain-containing protein [Opitutales bacterium]|nr:serine hydrolase domain-containing protein [Opitutales bacterium]
MRVLAADAPPVVAAAAPKPEVVKLSAEQVAAYRYYLENARQKIGLPGMAVVLVQPGQILLLEGLGKRTAGADASVTPDTRFALGPATAAVNSLLLARLATQNLLDLDAPAERCWDEFKLANANFTGNVTLRQMLAMTAGLPPSVDNMLRDPARGPAELFTIAAEVPDTAPPGKVFAYSDASVALAGYLAVDALNHHRAPEAGLPAGYAALAQTQLFAPLGLKRATFDAPTADDDSAMGHTRDGDNPWQPETTSWKISAALEPALGLRLSARDVAAWLQVELADGASPDGKQWIAGNLIELRWRPAPDIDSQGYGLGWDQQHYRGLEIIGRMGEFDNQSALVAIIPQYRTAIAILANGGGHEAAAFLQDALLNIADLLREAADK